MGVYNFPQFLAATAATALDPVIIIICILAGIVVRRWWQVFAGAGFAAFIVEMIVQALSGPYNQYQFGTLFPERFVAAAIICSATYWFTSTARRRKALGDQETKLAAAAETGEKPPIS